MMKEFAISTLLILTTGLAQAQGAWAKKSDFPGVASHEMACFDINGKGYVVGGAIAYPNWTNETWEYDPAGDSWVQKANLPTATLREPVAFALGGKGYAGTGMTGTSLVNTFYEYDPAANTWTQKANFGGTPRRDAVGFAIGSKGYIGTGADAAGGTKDFWEYTPGSNSWAKKTDFGGVVRNASVGFAIGSKGYITTGRQGSATYQDLWEYNPANNAWTQKANYSGVTRSECAVFILNGIAYVGNGHTGGSTDFWSYDPASNTWSSETAYPGTGAEVFESAGFAVNGKGYVVGGVVLGSGTQKALWEFSPSTTAVPEHEEDELKVFPNPSQGSIMIPVQNHLLELKTIEVIGPDGAHCRFDWDSNSHILRLTGSNIAQGYYTLRMASIDGKQYSRRILILN